MGRLLAILEREQAENRKRNFIERLQEVWYRQNRGKDVNLRIAHTYHSLGTALMDTGDLNRAASQLDQSVEMKRAIHDPASRTLTSHGLSTTLD